METIHLTRCGRSGNAYPPGRTFRAGDRVLTVKTSTRINTWGHPGMTACPVDDCWRPITITARPADVEDEINFLEEEARNAARREWYENLVRERRRQYLAAREHRPAD